VSGAPFEVTWRGQIRFKHGAEPSYTEAALSNLDRRPHPGVHGDVNLLFARPVPATPAPKATHSIYVEVGMSPDAGGVYRGFINDESYEMRSGGSCAAPPVYGDNAAFIAQLPKTTVIAGAADSPFVIPPFAVVDILVNNTDGGEHPFHLHGHRIWVLATNLAPDAEKEFGPDHVIRDVVSVPASGWAKVRFLADNPGLWLFHCHSARPSVSPARSDALTRPPVEWHMHAGLVTSVLEDPVAMQKQIDSDGLLMPSSHAEACSAYGEYLEEQANSSQQM
jgi:iron transport multicopper oxidase